MGTSEAGAEAGVQLASSTKSSPTASSLGPPAMSKPLRPVSAPPSIANTRPESHCATNTQSTNNTTAKWPTGAGAPGAGASADLSPGPCSPSPHALSPSSDSCTPLHMPSHQNSAAVPIRSELVDAAAAAGLSAPAVVTRVVPTPSPSTSVSPSASTSAAQASHALAQRTSSRESKKAAGGGDAQRRKDGTASTPRAISIKANASANALNSGARARAFRFTDVLASSVRAHPLSKALEALLARLALYRIPMLLISGLLFLDTVILLVIQFVDPPHRAKTPLPDQTQASPEELKEDIRYRYECSYLPSATFVLEDVNLRSNYS